MEDGGFDGGKGEWEKGQGREAGIKEKGIGEQGKVSGRGSEVPCSTPAQGPTLKREIPKSTQLPA